MAQFVAKLRIKGEKMSRGVTQPGTGSQGACAIPVLAEL